jgi:signal transduction histidine kinase/CheY-like chemotaxis protein
MDDSGLSQLDDVSTEVRTSLRELQAQCILFVLPAIWLAALVMVGEVPGFQDPLHGGVLAIILFLLPAIVLTLRNPSYLAAVWVLVLGLVGADLLLALWTRAGAALFLLALPAWLAASFISPIAGTLVAVGCAVVLTWVPAISGVAEPGVRSYALVGVCCTVAMVWLTRQPLFAELQRLWLSQAQRRRLLDQARDAQWQARQALKDLADANLQLARMNRLALALRHEAEEARRAKEEFVANVSHELRTPLNMVIGFSEMILDAPEAYGGDIPPALLADLAVIQRNSRHLCGLIDDVLDMSQIEVGQMALTRERTSLHEIVEAARVAVRPLFEAKELYLDVELPEDLPMVHCDRTRIREVMLNLLSNAGRFTERGGVRIEAWPDGKRVVVCVADTGPGIGADETERLFQPFQQLDNSVRRRFGGTGLGLSISKSFVELHGGRIWLESEIGAGSKFFFSLPIDPSQPVDIRPHERLVPEWEYRQRTRPSTAPRVKVRPRLVVLEKGASLQRLLRRYLDDVEVVTASTLSQAVRQLSDAPSQALLVNRTSLSEPLEDALAAIGGLPFGTPLVVTSVPGAPEVARAQGALDYLVKPISRRDLLGALERLQLSGGTVLIVDDEPEALRLFWRMLSSADAGYRVLAASSGRQALDILRREHADVVLLDLVMPDMDGFQFLAEKTEDPALRDTPVVVVSARDPSGGVIVSSALTVTCGGGLSIRQLLSSIHSLIRILAPGGLPVDRGQLEAQPG